MTTTADRLQRPMLLIGDVPCEDNRISEFITQEAANLLGDKPAVVLWLDTLPRKMIVHNKIVYSVLDLEKAKPVPADQAAFFKRNLNTLFNPFNAESGNWFVGFTPESGDRDDHGLIQIHYLDKTARQTPLQNATDASVFAEKIRIIAEEYGHAADHFHGRTVCAHSPKEYATEVIAKTYALLRTMQYFRQTHLPKQEVKKRVLDLIKTETINETLDCQWANRKIQYPHLSLPILAHLHKDGGKVLDQYLNDPNFTSTKGPQLFEQALNMVERHMPPQATLYKDLEFIVQARETGREKKLATNRHIDDMEREFNIPVSGCEISSRDFFRDAVAAVPENSLSDAQRDIRHLTLAAFKDYCKSSLSGEAHSYTQMVRVAMREGKSPGEPATRIG